MPPLIGPQPNPHIARLQRYTAAHAASFPLHYGAMHQSNVAYAEQLVQLCTEKSLVVSTAESCTGGGVAHAITSVAGSSVMFDAAYVTYSNAAKGELLNVPASLIDQHGAVSKAVVQTMARNALNARTDISVALSGVAGPGGGTATKPVGTVWIAWAYKDQILTEKNVFAGDRNGVRNRAVYVALTGLLSLANRIEDRQTT